MHQVSLLPQWLLEHEQCYSLVTWEIVGYLSTGQQVWVSNELLDAGEVPWGVQYFTELKAMKDVQKLDVLVGKPSDLQRVIDAECSFLLARGYAEKDGRVVAPRKDLAEDLERVRTICSRIFSYNRFLAGKTLRGVKSSRIEYEECLTPGKWGGERFFENLQTNFCLYCNKGEVYYRRMTRTSVNGVSKSTVQHTGYDHYFKKELYPYLAISLYNLIPACDDCNQHKKTQIIMNAGAHSHPYIHDFHALMAFRTDFRKLRQLQGCPRNLPLRLERRGSGLNDEQLAENLASEIGLMSDYKASAVVRDETIRVLRIMDSRLSEIANYRVRRKDLAWLAKKNQIDFGFNLAEGEINLHCLAKLKIDLIAEYGLENDLGQVGPKDGQI